MDDGCSMLLVVEPAAARANKSIGNRHASTVLTRIGSSIVFCDQASDKRQCVHDLIQSIMHDEKTAYDHQRNG
jgi:hypothetical protein